MGGETRECDGGLSSHLKGFELSVFLYMLQPNHEYFLSVDKIIQFINNNSDQ